MSTEPELLATSAAKVRTSSGKSGVAGAALIEPAADVVVVVVVVAATGFVSGPGAGLLGKNICMPIHITSISDAVVTTRDIELPPWCWGSRGGRNPPGELLISDP